MTTGRRHHDSGTAWEPVAGYSRAVRAGNWICVSGTTAVQADGGLPRDLGTAEQMFQCLEHIRAALEALGGRLEDVVRTRIYVTNIEDWEAVARVHRDWFGAIRPATSMVEVSRLIHPALKVEVEADALVEA